MSRADVILALGTELSETDSFVERLDLNGKLIRVDLDSRKMNDLYPADIGIVADARHAVGELLNRIGPCSADRGLATEIRQIRSEVTSNLGASEPQHVVALEFLKSCLPEDVVIMGDICQLVYTGAFAFDASRPRQWHYPAGFCTLGCGLPNAIGAKLALPHSPVLCLAGDGGFMFTVQELVTAAELKLPIPIIIWINGGLKQIQDDMKSRDIALVGVEGMNPDFLALAHACGCHAEQAGDADTLRQALAQAFAADRPTLIQVTEGDPWLLGH